MRATDIYVGAGGGVDAAFAVSGDSSGTDGLTIRVGSFLSQSNATVSALGYNQLWVNNQISLLTPVDGATVTRTISAAAGSFASDGITDALFETANTAFNNQRLWVLVSNNSTFTSSSQYALLTSTNSTWTLPADVTAASQQNIDSAQLTSAAFGSFTSLGAGDVVNLGIVPATYLYWDSNNAAGLGGSGTWSDSNSQLGWTTNASGLSANGTYAWGTTSGTDYYAGAGLAAHFGGTAGTVTVSGTVQARNGLYFDPTSGSYALSGGTINLAGSASSNNTLTVATGDTASISSILTGSTGLTKAGAGTLTLSGANTFSGGATLNAGQLNINNAAALGSGTFTITTGTIDNTSGGAITLSNDNAQAWNGAFTFSGSNNLNMGTGTVTLGANTGVTVSANSLTIGGPVTGAFNLNKLGAGNLVLNGANTHSGTTTLDVGTLTLGNVNALQNSLLFLYNTTSTLSFGVAGTNTYHIAMISSGANGAMDIGGNTISTGANNSSATFQGVIAGVGGSLIKVGTGTLTLNGTSANTFNGTTTVNAGTLRLGKTDGVNAIAGNISIGDGSGSDVILLISGNQIADSSVVTMSGTVANQRGGFYLNGFNETIGGLSGDGLIQVETTSSSAASTLTLQVGSDLSFTSNAFIRNSNSGNSVLSITKSGPGTQILSNAANAYTGATTINGGNLSVSTLANGGSASNIGSSSAAAANLVLGGGTLRYTGSTASTDRAFTLTAATTSAIDVSNSATTLTISGASASTTGALVKTGAGALTLSGANSWSGGTTLSAGTLNINHATAIGSGTFTIGAGTTLDNTSGSSITLSNNNAQAWNGNFTFTGTNSLNLGTGTIALGGNLTVAVNGNTLTAGNISGTNTTLTKSGAGTLVLTDVNRSAWTGGVVLQAGTLGITNGNNLGALPGSPAAQLTFSGNSTLQFQGSTGAPVGANRVFSIDSGVTATIDTQSFNVSLANAVQGDGSFAKTGTGTLTLSGSNTYSGATTVNAGTLNAANANALGSTSSVTVNGGSLLVGADDAINSKSLILNKAIVGNATAAQASLAFGGAYSNTSGTAGSLTLSQDSIIDLGTGGVVVHFASIANLNSFVLHIFNWEGDTVWSGSPGGGKDQFYVDQNLGTTALGNIRFYSGTTQSSFLSTGFQIIGGSFNQEIIAVPEPETYATAIVLVFFGAYWIWRRHAAGKSPPPRLSERALAKRMPTPPPM